MALADLLECDVVYARKAWSNSRGRRTDDGGATYDLRAAVQEMGGSRVHRHGLVRGEAGFTVYFDLDDFRAGPVNAATGDVVTWQGRTLSVLARERDEGGAGRVLSVDCKELA